MSGNKWDNKYLELAAEVSSWSKDPSSKVGAVIVKNNRVVATGFNGFPTSVEDKEEWLDTRKLKYEMVVHAEVNALISAGQRAEGATIYVIGRPVCSACAGALIQAGVARVVAERPPALKGGFDAAVKILTTAPPNVFDSKIWDIKGLVAQHMFSHARVSFDTHPHSSFKKKAKRAKPTSRTAAKPPVSKAANSNKKETKRRLRPAAASTAVRRQTAKKRKQ